MLVLLLAAVYGTARLAVWYSVKDAVSNARESLSPLASLEYSKTLSPVFGAFGISGIHIRPHLLDGELTIGSALVHIDDPIEKYHFLRATFSDRVPTHLKFSLNRIRVGLEGSMASWLDQNTTPRQSTSGAPAACAVGAPFTVQDIRNMGYDELVANVNVDYAYNRRQGGLVAYTRISLEEMFEVTLETRIPAGELVLDLDRMQGLPRLSNLTVSFADLSWASRFNRYCAAKLGMEEEQFIHNRMAETRHLFSTGGFEPSDGLLAALETLARGNGQLTVNFNPRDPVALTSLDISEDFEYLIDKLGLEVLVDGKPVQSLGTVRELPVEETEQEKQQLRETYKPTPLTELPRFIDNRIRIITKSGATHEGSLDGVEADRIILTRHLAGGSATFDVDRADIERILVLRP